MRLQTHSAVLKSFQFKKNDLNLRMQLFKNHVRGRLFFAGFKTAEWVFNKKKSLLK